MRDIPNDIVVWHVKDIMEGNRQLIHAQRGTQVTPRFGNGLEYFPSQFVGELWISKDQGEFE
jgi:hypothetical protein